MSQIKCNYPPMQNFVGYYLGIRDYDSPPGAKNGCGQLPGHNSLNMDFLDRLGSLAAGGEERPRVGQEMLTQCLS